MNEIFDRIRRQVGETLTGFTTGQKAVTGGVVLALLVGAYLFTGWASTPSYSPLYTDLAPADAAAVTEELASQGVAYRLADGGRTVLVPSGKLYDLRIALSSEGLPSAGNTGYALLDKQGITASEFRQRVDFQRALEGELAKTIGAIESVSAATVHLVIPEEDLFTNDAEKASASVLVRPRSGNSLTSGEVQAVLHLVSSSVEGLLPENVTITDSQGNLLSTPGEDGMDLARGDARANQTLAYEKQLAGSLEDMLEKVVGAGGAVVRVSADLDFDKRRETTERFEAENAPVLSETTSNETFTGASPTVGGPLGEGELQANAQEQNFEKEQASRTFAPSKVTTETDTTPGSVERLSVSVLLDSEAGPGVALDAIEEQVAAAAGLDPARGDTVSVARVPFDRSAAEEADEAARIAADQERWDSLMATARAAVTLLVVGIGLLIGYRRLARGSRREEEIPLEQLAIEGPEPTQPVLEIADDDIVELEPSLVAVQEGGGPETVLVQRRTRRELDRLPGMEERMAAHADIADLIDRQPEDVAQLLRSWLSERR